MDLEEANDAIKPGDNVARSKTEIEFEEHVLDTKVRLSDGTEACVFSRTPRNKDLLFGYMCHICGVACLYGERMLQIHIAGRKHQARLNVTVFDAEQYRASLVAKPTKGTSGSNENNTSTGSGGGGGQENDSASPSSMKPQARLQNVLDGYRDGPLVGLEYIVELIDSANGADPVYSCVLCNLHNNNESGITTHMIGMGHRFKFLEKHYPTVRKMLSPYRNNNQENGGQVFFRVVQTVCEAIEDHHGRLTPQVYEAAEFERNRVKFGQQISFGTHFDERTGPKFVEVIDAKVLQDLVTAEDCGGGQVQGAPKRYRMRNERRSSLDSISSVSSANSMLTISSSGDDENRGRTRKRSPLNGQGNRLSGGGGRGDLSYQRQQRAAQPANSSAKQMLPTPRELSIQSAAIAHERYKWEKYRCTVDIAVEKLEKQLKDHEKNPEKHPLYSEEWKKFWNRRYKELQAEKKDPAKHNFKPEWIEFWTKRMKELHDEEVARKKEEIRTKMNLPAEDEERTGELREQYALRVPQAGKRARSSERKAGTAAAPILIDVNSDEEEDDYKGGQPMRSKNRSSPRSSRRGEWSDSGRKRSTSRSHRSRSPISDDNGYEGGYSRSRSQRAPPMDYRGEWPVGKHRGGPVPERVDYDEWAKNYYGPNKKVFVRTEFDADSSTPLNFVAVCRLLTAFEEYLGSLGPKVNDLLAKALALEKVKANSADDLLLNEDNCMFLETVKEKLKGHMMAETIDANRMVPIKKAVRNIARLLHEASKREPVKPPEEELSRDSVAVSEAAVPSAVPTAAATTISASAAGASIDKIAVAEQLAKSLVAQGKTDFTTEELEQLINVYVTMAQMSREKNSLVTAKAYMATLPPSAVPVAPKEIVPAPVAAQAAGPSKLPERLRPEAAGSAGGAARWNDKKMDVPVRSGNFGSMADNDEDEPSSSILENLTDSDLQTLLQSFKELSNDEQMHLISYLRKLERTEPERVERLRRYVNFDSWSNPKAGGNDGGNGARRDAASRMSDEDEPASKNVSNVPLLSGSKMPADAYDTSSNHSHRTSGNNDTGSGGGNSSAGISLSDTQNLIANLMESLQKSVSDANSHSTAGASSAAGSNSYANPITTIGGTAGGGGGGGESAVGKTIPGKITSATPNASSMYPGFPQQQQQHGQSMGMGMPFGGQQGQMPMGQMSGPQGQMQQQFGNPYMYQGQQMFGANGPGPQQMQQFGGYGNYGYY
uniref:C2H2-type domain-containing protein n=1 Tax=Anopheles merus TaxID=30066 RepID=A0A182VFQ8_ANOME